MSALWKQHINTGLRFCILPALALGLALKACKAENSVRKPSTIDAKRLTAENIRINGVLSGAYQISDRNGDHILVLTRKEGPSPVAPQSGRIEHIDLVAVYYLRVAKLQWKEEWIIRDASDCPSLDVDGNFFMPYVTFTDLNDDGIVEVTVPYRLTCAGAIEPSKIKIILREGSTKLAIPGESLVQINHAGVAPFGGEHTHDAALLKLGRAAYKQHLDAVWKKVQIEKRE